jgi:hypothetical protein
VSVERVQRKSGVVWRVRWRENGRPRSHVAGNKRDAELFDAEIKLRKRMGQLAQIDAGRETVAEFAREWWRIHAVPNLAARTLETYAIVFDKHILPRVGSLALRDVTPMLVVGMRADMQAAGVGPAATRKALTILQGIFSCAVGAGVSHCDFQRLGELRGHPEGTSSGGVGVLSRIPAWWMESCVRGSSRGRGDRVGGRAARA